MLLFTTDADFPLKRESLISNILMGWSRIQSLPPHYILGAPNQICMFAVPWILLLTGYICINFF